MTEIEREIERLNEAMLEVPHPRYSELYAAQQALSWALDHKAFRSPADYLLDFPISPATSMPA